MSRTIIRAGVLGFCMGVRRAMDKAEKAVSVGREEGIYTFGPLIHNRHAIEDLEKRGIGRIDSPEEYSGGSVIIRAHGVPKSTRESLVASGATLVDGTCPRVTRSMKLVERYGKRGYQVVLVGDPGHGEVQAVAGYAEDTMVVSSREEARELELVNPTLVIAQTTIAAEEYQRVIEVLREKNVPLEVIESICPATRERREALEELSERVEAIVVIGGLDSSNTKRLHQLALSLGKPAWHVEIPEQIPDEIKRYHRIGLSAGASTPDRIIDEVEQYIQNLDEEE